MSYTLDVQPDQPVIIVTYHGTVDAKELAEAQQATIQAGQKFDPKPDRLFNIQDIRAAQVDFLDGFLHSRQMMFAPQNARPSDIQVYLIFVGTNRVAESYRQLRKVAPTGKVQVSIVSDMDEAMALVKSMSVPSR